MVSIDRERSLKPSSDSHLHSIIMFSRLGFFFSPLLPAVIMITSFVFFYVKKVSPYINLPPDSYGAKETAAFEPGGRVLRSVCAVSGPHTSSQWRLMDYREEGHSNCTVRKN